MDRTIQHCTKKCQKGYESALFCYYPNKDRHAEATIKCSFNLLCIMSLHKTPLQEIVCASNVQCPGNPRSLLGKRELVEYGLPGAYPPPQQTHPLLRNPSLIIKRRQPKILLKQLTKMISILIPHSHRHRLNRLLWVLI